VTSILGGRADAPAPFSARPVVGARIGAAPPERISEKTVSRILPDRAHRVKEKAGPRGHPTGFRRFLIVGTGKTEEEMMRRWAITPLKMSEFLV
jgi:hypothetical protein